ncbi:hypothetical protein [Ilumatobacter nonamiensis]|uniref:hypothetical protein n=1 Tax=Ilumatobacter nonamiensis TaxID=467093 RepID=UPI0011D25876|nr:hypothetical protein [Ilumatobacter nonamiensis]
MATKKPMTDEHKAALAKGRTEGRIVREYLEGLRATKPKRGRKRTPESVRKRLDAVEQELASADPMSELLLIQERRDLEAELEAMSATIDIEALESRFVEVAQSYSDSKSISYASWRDVGVPAAVLKRAGVSRAS